MSFPTEVGRGFRGGARRLLLLTLALAFLRGEAFGAPPRQPQPPEAATQPTLTTQQARAYAEVLKMRPTAARNLLKDAAPNAAGTVLGRTA